jgi:AcrR family transcriptional regulator
MLGMERLLPVVRSRQPDEPAQKSLLDAALNAFLDFGIKRTSMGEVARRAGLSVATMYRRFDQKSDLIQAVGLREVSRFIEAVDCQVDRTASAEEQITELFLGFTHGLRGNELLTRLLQTEPELVLPRLTIEGYPVIELGRDYLVEFIHRLQDEGKLPDYDATPVAEIIARVSLSMALTPQTSLPMNDDDAARRFVRQHIAVAFGLPHSNPT